MEQSPPPASSYPTTAHEPAPLVDLADRARRERLGPSALRAFFNIAAHWKLRDADARRLLGDISNGSYYAMKRDPNRVLDQDRLVRVSFLVGIFKALDILYPGPLADAWVQRPNANRIFAGQTPLAYMIKGGVPALQIVRRLLDARRGGP